MGNTRNFVRSASAALGIVLAFALSAAAQQTPTPQVRTAGQQFKNIKVLTDIPAGDVVPAMHLFEGELGVTCGFCHVVDHWEQDDVPKKDIARKMITMMSNINMNNFDGKQVVTCYTCHRGNSQPVGTLVLPPASIAFAPYTSEWHPVQPSFPPADQIIAKYIQALGGEQALRKITSRTITADRTVPTGEGGTVESPAQGEIYLKAPNLMLSIGRTDKITIAEGYDGATAWAQGANGQVNPRSPLEQARAKRNMNFYEPLELKNEYTKLEVTAVEKVNNRDAYVVMGTPAGDSPEKLYFDMQTGFLVRRVTTFPTLAGPSPYEVEYDDYRDTGSGVKIPFLVRSIPSAPRAPVASRITFRIQKVQDNLPIDDSKFVKPQSKPVPPPAR